MGHLSVESHVLFLLAFRWLSSATFVFPPYHDDSQTDIFEFLFEENDTNSGALQLKYWLAEDWVTSPEFKIPVPRALEPRVACRVLTAGGFEAETRPDFALLARSPEFAPQKADRIVPVICEYLDVDLSVSS